MDALKDARVLGAVGLVLAAGSGAVGGYIFAQKKFQNIADEEIVTFKEDYARRRDLADKNERAKAEMISYAKAEMISYVKADIAETEKLLVDNQYVPSIDEHDSEALEAAVPTLDSNIFDTTPPSDPEWDQDFEESQRTAEPYIISLYEWGDRMYETRKRFTYFAGDDVLADEAEMHIPDVDSIVGEDNLLKFGHGSKDPNVVYVRNDNLEIDFEIILSNGEYAAEVHNLRHSDNRPVLKRFRDRD